MSTNLTPSMYRSMLISMLRDKSLWPKDFVWDFSKCQTCAMGMLIETVNSQSLIYDHKVGEILGISCGEVSTVFKKPAHEVPIPYKMQEFIKALQDVTPEMVANRLERLHNELKEKEV